MRRNAVRGWFFNRTDRAGKCAGGAICRFAPLSLTSGFVDNLTNGRSFDYAP